LRRKVKSGFQDTSPLAARSFISDTQIGKLPTPERFSLTWNAAQTCRGC
jgi:hypothetical protein